MNHAVDNQPWYAPHKRRSGVNAGRPATNSNRPERPELSLLGLIIRLFDGLMALFSAFVTGILVCFALTFLMTSTLKMSLLVIATLFFGVSIYFMIRQLGCFLKVTSPRQYLGTPLFEMGLNAVRGEIPLDDSRKGVPAPELALHQFVQQVRAYATEKSFQKVRQIDRQDQSSLPFRESSDLLKRRWNEVVDSLSEFEVYLANDPKGMIENFVSKSPIQMMDVSQIFRDVAESFDNTWRRKGINIESAIVTPLKATTNEALLRRLLVGLWRTCAYLARRGNGVVFSAKSEGGVVTARWDCEGLVIPDEFLEMALRTELSINERIEFGLRAMATDPINGNLLHAVISFITWIDLAICCKADFEMKPTNESFVFLMRLK